ncbi:hypothetical protein [uncultured Faecalibaculum sp.]|uniref:hypothetical protein n=1 Tax=uncultured Faecalibaculum sp. TaxID=1729681 RepID=UPI00272DCE1A|nr:hypothetical protein [uncultured Faecalibaculum sp.]
MNLIDTFDCQMLMNLLKNHGFDLIKDLKRTGLRKSGYARLIQDVTDDVSNNNFGDRLIQSDAIDDLAVYKARYKDTERGEGKRGGYRVILVVGIGDIAFIAHIYHKHAGKHSKPDLTDDDRKNLRKLVQEIEAGILSSLENDLE